MCQRNRGLDSHTCMSVSTHIHTIARCLTEGVVVSEQSRWQGYLWGLGGGIVGEKIDIGCNREHMHTFCFGISSGGATLGNA